MAIAERIKHILWGKSGATCAFPDCHRSLVASANENDPAVVLGEIAHIVAQSPGGPRSDQPPPGGQVDGYDNLLLLCHAHHEMVDRQPNTYTVQKLVQMKADHERWVEQQLTPRQWFLRTSQPEAQVTDTVFSTLLPVTHMPITLFGVICGLDEQAIREKILFPAGSEVMLPYIVRERQLFTFDNLTHPESPFRQAADLSLARPIPAASWWDDPDRTRWYVDLLNRALNKLTGRKGLQLDKEHRRYYFEPTNPGQDLSVFYTSLTGKQVSRKVAWNPTFKHSGEGKKYWEHMAVGLAFHRVADGQWCLSIRPERRFTTDGFTPITPKGTGRRATSRKSRMYNIDVLTEVNFWRDVLSSGKPRIVLDFGGQHLTISTELLNTTVSWPGVPDDAKAFTHVRYEEDLFTLAELEALDDEAGDLAELEFDEEDDDDAP